MSSSRKIRLFSDVGAKMSMFNKRAEEHRDSQLVNPFSEWGGAGTRRKMSREDPEYGRPVEGSKTAERGRLAQMQMIGDMVELCDMIYDCGIRSPDGRAAISFGDAFRLYSSINDKVVGLLMRGRKHKILDFEGEMLFQGRDDRKMIELLLPLNTIRHKYGMPERAGCGEVDHDLLQMLAEQDRKQKQQRKQQRTRSVGVPPLPPVRHQKSRSIDNGRPSAQEARGMLGAARPDKADDRRGESGESSEEGERGEGGEARDSEEGGEARESDISGESGEHGKEAGQDQGSAVRETTAQEEEGVTTSGVGGQTAQEEEGVTTSGVAGQTNEAGEKLQQETSGAADGSEGGRAGETDGGRDAASGTGEVERGQEATSGDSGEQGGHEMTGGRRGELRPAACSAQC